jgi:hypothetical protein
VSGLLNGLAIANALLARQQGEEEREYLRGEREYQRGERERQGEWQNISRQLELATHPALARVGPGQERRSVEAYVAPGARKALAGVTPETSFPSAPSSYALEMPVDETLSYGKRRYAIRGPKERLGRKMQEAEALANVKAIAEGDAARKKLEATGLLVSGEDLNKLSIQGGSRRIMPKDLSGIATFGKTLADIRSEPTGEKEAPIQLFEGQRGLFAVPREKGTKPELVEFEGKAIRRPKAVSAAGAGGLTPGQAATQERARQKELGAMEVKEHGDPTKIEKEGIPQTVGLHELRSALIERIAAGPGFFGRLSWDEKKRDLQKKLKTVNNQLRRIYKRKLQLRAITQEQYAAMVADLEQSEVAAAEAPAAPIDEDAAREQRLLKKYAQ